MKKVSSDHRSQQCSRRSFLGKCATCAAAFAAAGAGTTGLTRPACAAPEGEKARVTVLYLYPDPSGPIWPNIGYDFAGRIRELTAGLVGGCPGIDFSFEEVTSGTEADARKIVERHADADGFVVYLVGCLWGVTPQVVAASGKPVVMVDELFAGSGEFLTAYAQVKREGRKAAAVSSSRFGDVLEAVRSFECLHALRRSTMLVVGAEPDSRIEPVFGTTVRVVPFSEINAAYKVSRSPEIRAVADRWVRGAEKVVEPGRAEIEKSAAMYLAMSSLLEKHRARAITINCLGGIYSKNMVEAYPCLGFAQLDDDGLVGACEADQRSTITKMLMSSLTGRPGFISDPVIDTSRNRIIYAHCVGPTKVYGPSGAQNPYHIRDHSEDRKGACNRSLMPLGEMTTTVLFDYIKREVIMHQGVTVENVDDDKACRTKLAVEVKGDVYKLMEYWDQWGWHRVTFYGDLKRQVYNIAALTGFRVVEEA